MRITSSSIHLNNIRIYAYHGVFEQENIVGNMYRLDISVDVDYSEAAFSDNLCNTVSYADIMDVVKREMAIKSKLLEHVAYRIATSLLNDFHSIMCVCVNLDKENPPMEADIESAGVRLSVSR